MRPQRSAADHFRPSVPSFASGSHFNEAAAFCRGSPRLHRVFFASLSHFNEAAAFCRGSLGQACRRQQRARRHFNEAAAFCRGSQTVTADSPAPAIFALQ